MGAVRPDEVGRDRVANVLLPALGAIADFA